MIAKKIRIRSVFTRIGRQIDRLRYGGNSPSSFIVGAQKAGTSSLFRYLNGHPSLTGAQSKEVGYFDKEYRYSKGTNWYERQFLRKGTEPQSFFEATPEYLYRKSVPKRIYDYNPDAKIIIVLREPVSRAYSAWNMYMQLRVSGRHPKILDRHYDGGGAINPLYAVFLSERAAPSFQEYLDLEFDLIERNDSNEEPGLIRRGIYLPQIERYVDLFGANNVLIIGSKELRTKTAETVNMVATFMTGVDMEIYSESFNTQFHRRDYREQIPPDCSKRLSEFYREHNDELWKYLGRVVSW